MQLFQRTSHQAPTPPPAELEQSVPTSDSTYDINALPDLDSFSPITPETRKHRGVFLTVGTVALAGAVTLAALAFTRHGDTENTQPNPNTPVTLGLPAPGETPTNKPSPLDGKDVSWDFPDFKKYTPAYEANVLDEVKRENSKEDDDIVLNKFSRKHNLSYTDLPGTSQPVAYGECDVRSTGKLTDTSDNSNHTLTTITVNPITFTEQDTTPGSKNRFIYTTATGIEKDTGYQTTENHFYEVDGNGKIIWPVYPDNLTMRTYTTGDSQKVNVNILSLFTKDPQITKWQESGFIAANGSSGPTRLIVGGIVTVKDLPVDQEKTTCDYLVSISHS